MPSMMFPRTFHPRFGRRRTVFNSLPQGQVFFWTTFCCCYFSSCSSFPQRVAWTIGATASTRHPLQQQPFQRQERRWYAAASGNLDDLIQTILLQTDKRSNPAPAWDATTTFPSASVARWRNVEWPFILEQNQKAETKQGSKQNNHHDDYGTATQQFIMPPSPVQITMILNRLVHIKRDDQLRLAGSQISGNKARKMVALQHFLDTLDHGCSSSSNNHKKGSNENDNNVRAGCCLVSYGGPQSNAMLALAAVVHFQNEKWASKQQQQEIAGAEINSVKGVDDDNDNNIVYNEYDDEDDQEYQEYDDDDDNNLESSSSYSLSSPLQPLQRHRFIYYTKRLPRFLRQQPSGNLFRAQSLGMELVELDPSEYHALFGEGGGRIHPPPGLEPPAPNMYHPHNNTLANCVWIPQGGACGVALAGTRQLAQEIVAYWNETGRGRPLSVVLPGGTCTTAALLHWALSDIQQHAMDIQVVVIPCVGDVSYAHRQMMSLYSQLGLRNNDSEEDLLPIILPPSVERYGGNNDGNHNLQLEDYFTFGEPDAAILETFTRMKEENDIVLDLLYGAPAWTILLRHLRAGHDNNNYHSPLDGREILYVHSGGLEGINSQLLRYKYKGLLDIHDIQLPGSKKRKT